MDGAPRRGCGRIILEWAILLLVLAVLVRMFFPCLLPGHSKCMARQGAAEHLIDNLDQAAKAYEFDHGVYPPGDGRGSAGLVRCLGSKGPKGIAYYEFTPEMLAPDGSVVNPVWPGEPPPLGILHYRNNLLPGGVPDPAPRNLKLFDLWGAGCKYDPGKPSTAWEVNNWTLE